MKAIIGGITIEGTPQEIMEYQRLQAEQVKMKPKYPYSDIQPWYEKTPHNSGTAKPNFPPDTMIICMNMQ